jgi:hypothetical protein
MLSFLTAEHGSGGALLCSCDGDHVIVEVARTMRADRLAVFNGAWRDHRGEILDGRLVERPEYVLAPLEHRGVVGVLYLDAPIRFRKDGLEIYLLALAKGLLSARAQGPETGAGVGVDQRSLLATLLERHEWNIARVARALGLTRRTIYLRMEKYGIRRKHVPKTLKSPL